MTYYIHVKRIYNNIRRYKKMSNFGLTPYRKRNNALTPFSLVDSFLGDDFFRSFFSDSMIGSSRINIDVKDEKDKYVIEAELPGAKKEDIKIDIDNGILTLSTEYSSQKNNEKENYIYRERRYGSVCRSFSLENIDDENIDAKYEDGILTIDLPKKEENKKATRAVIIK
jgi:HSP20 family protein